MFKKYIMVLYDEVKTWLQAEISKRWLFGTIRIQQAEFWGFWDDTYSNDWVKSYSIVGITDCTNFKNIIKYLWTSISPPPSTTVLINFFITSACLKKNCILVSKTFFLNIITNLWKKCSNNKNAAWFHILKHFEGLSPGAQKDKEKNGPDPRFLRCPNST